MDPLKAIKNKDNILVAKQALITLRKAVHSSRKKDSRELLKNLNDLKHSILSTREKDPVTKNALNSIFYNIRPLNINKTKHELNQRINEAFEHISNSHTKIAEVGHKKIRKGMVVYVHGYSSSIIDLLIKSKKQGTNFEVVTTETSPFLSGYLIASEISRHKIPVRFYADLALRQALKKADIVLLGAATIAENGQVYSELGSELIADLADKYDVPVYVCTDCWKFNPITIQEYERNKSLRPHQEIWRSPPKGVQVLNYEYEKIHPKLITGVVTEMGIYKPHYLISEIRKHYPWIK